MKKTVFIAISLFILVALPLTTAESQDTSEYSYEGVATCAMCHKSAKQGEQDRIWRESLHAHAYEVLLSDEAKKISQDKGLGADAHKAEECLKCHATGHNVDAAKLGRRFKIEDGVQCETCHGPGSGYKSIKIMKDREAAIANGLVVHENTEAFCVTCHNEESPTFADFNFVDAWAKISHPVPN